MSMRILCGTDFGGSAEVAERIALDLAGRTSGQVELLHVMTPVVLEPVIDPQALGGALQAAARDRLTEEARSLSKGRVPVTAHLAEGLVEQRVIERGKETDADVIVMGARHHTALGRFLLGSAADRTLRHADRPVLIVPSDVRGALHEGPGPLKVMVALEDGASSDGALAFVRRLRGISPCDVVFLRLYWPVEEYQRLGLTGARDLSTADPDVVSDLERAVRERVGVLAGAGATAVAVEVAWGSPAEQILAAAAKHGCDLLIMGAESRHGLARVMHPPVAERVARQATAVPVLFVPSPAPGDAHRAGHPPRFRTVLMATDFSNEGNQAVPFAYALLEGKGGVIELCHVHERALASPAYAYEVTEGRLTKTARQDVEQRLRALIPAGAEARGVTTHITIIDGGHAAEAIVQASERLSVDAIVLGVREGRRLAVGSVSQAVAHASRRPVMLIPASDLR
ncbi:MAG TPA: universal stress protein [Polyangia bacterium]|nr:universal stress protein [Polyangia bacterium]